MSPKSKSPRKNHLPVYRIRNIMKTNLEVAAVGNDAAIMMTIAAELFIRLLAEEASKNAETTEVDYNDLAEVVHNDKRYSFLRVVVPQKITVGKYKELLEKSQSLISDEDLSFYIQ